MELIDLLLVGAVIMIAFWCWILFKILTTRGEDER
jgi:hypothetical protein